MFHKPELNLLVGIPVGMLECVVNRIADEFATDLVRDRVRPIIGHNRVAWDGEYPLFLTILQLILPEVGVLPVAGEVKPRVFDTGEIEEVIEGVGHRFVAYDGSFVAQSNFNDFLKF